MKILLTNDFSKSMAEQPKEELQTFIEYVDKLTSLTKKEILSLDEVTSLSNPEDKTKIFGYGIPNDFYVIFSFTSKNDMLLVDRVQLDRGYIKSTTYPKLPSNEAG